MKRKNKQPRSHNNRPHDCRAMSGDHRTKRNPQPDHAPETNAEIERREKERKKNPKKVKGNTEAHACTYPC